MTVEHTSALIYYNDSENPLLEEDQRFAKKLADVLREDAITTEMKGYSHSAPGPDIYQWLIFIHTPKAVEPPMHDIVDTACRLVVQRRMRGVLVVTTIPSDLPPEWASIRRYDVSGKTQTEAVLQNIRRDMHYVKIPYTQTRALKTSFLKRMSLSQKRLAVVISLLLVILIAISGVISSKIYSLHENDLHTASLTATAQAKAQKTQKAQLTATALPQARQNDLQAIIQTSTTISGFHHLTTWSLAGSPTDTPTATNTRPCTRDYDTYTASIAQSNQYVPCIAQTPFPANFALQMQMLITGDAGGVIFRFNQARGTYYRMAVSQQNAQVDTISMYLCNSDCTPTSTTNGTSLINLTGKDPIPSVSPIDQNLPILLSIIVRDNNTDIFINKTFVTHVTDHGPTLAPGQIGVYAASLGQPTTVVFSDLKIWKLPDSPTVQTSPTAR